MPEPPRFSLQEWGIIVAIVTAAAAAAVAVWTKVLRPFLVWTHRVFSEAALRAELADMREHKRAIGVLTRQQAATSNQISDMEPQVKLIPLIDERVRQSEKSLERIERGVEALERAMIELGGRDGGRRKYDKHE